MLAVDANRADPRGELYVATRFAVLLRKGATRQAAHRHRRRLHRDWRVVIRAIVRKVLIAVVLVVLVLVVAAGLVVRRLIDPENLKQALERQASAAVGQPVAVGALSWEGLVRPRVVLEDVRIGAPAGITISRVEVAANLRGLLSRRVQDAGLAISGTRVQFPLPFRVVGTEPPSPGGAAVPTPTEGGGFVVDSVERISLDDIVLAVGATHLRLDAESSLAGDRLVMKRVRLASAHTVIEGSGELSSVAARQGTFSLKADPLDLDEVLAIAAAFSQPAASETASTQPPIDLRLDITAPRGQMLGIEATQLATTIAVTPRDVTLEPFSVGMFGGTVKGRLSIDRHRRSRRFN